MKIRKLLLWGMLTTIIPHLADATILRCGNLILKASSGVFHLRAPDYVLNKINLRAGRESLSPDFFLLKGSKRLFGVQSFFLFDRLGRYHGATTGKGTTTTFPISEWRDYLRVIQLDTATATIAIRDLRVGKARERDEETTYHMPNLGHWVDIKKLGRDRVGILNTLRGKRLNLSTNRQFVFTVIDTLTGARLSQINLEGEFDMQISEVRALPDGGGEVELKSGARLHTHAADHSLAIYAGDLTPGQSRKITVTANGWAMLE